MSLKFLLQAEPEQAEAAIKRLEGTTGRAASAIEGDFARASSGISSSVAGILPTIGIASAAVTALAGTIVGLAKHAAEAGDRIYEASVKTGISAKQLSGLAAVSKETGESFESLQLGLGRAGRNIAMALAAPMTTSSKLILELAGGADHLREVLARPGGTGDALQMLLHRIFELKDPTQRNLELQALLGRGWMTNTLTLQYLAKEGYGPAIEKAKKFGMFYDDKSAAQAHNFVEEMNRLKAEIEGIALRIGQWLVPRINEWLAGLAGLLPRLEDWGLKIKAVAAAMSGNWSAATELWKASNDKFRESVVATADAMIKQQEDLNKALANMHDPAAHAALDLEKLHEAKQKNIKANLTEIETEVMYDAALLKSSDMLKAYSTIMEEVAYRSERTANAQDHLIETLGRMRAQAERLKESSERAKKEGIPAAPELQLSPQQIAKQKEAEDAMMRLANATKKQTPFTHEAAEAWQHYYDALNAAKNPLQQISLITEKVVATHRQGLPIMMAFAKALGDSGKNAEESAKQEVLASAQATLSHIIGRRAMAAVETVVETARGFQALAGQRYWSAAMHFLSATEWGIIAGKGGGHHGAAGGAGAAKPETAETTGLPGVAGGGGGRTGGGGGTTHQSIVNIYGGQITDTHNLQNLAAALNSGGNTGTIKLNTGGSAYTIPSPAY